MLKLSSRPLLTPTRAILLTAVFLVATANAAFFGQLLDVYPLDGGNLRFLLSVAVVLLCSLTLIMSLLSVLLPVRVVLGTFILLAAAIGFFADNFGIVIDSVMLQNVMETDAAEAGDLLTAGFFLRFIVFGIFPVAALCMLKMQRASYPREMGYKALTAVGALLIASICLFSFSDQYAGFFRQQKSLRYYTNPTFALYSAGKLMGEKHGVEAAEKFVELLPEAKLPENDLHHELIIMVVGETARRDRFSLNGYGRVTNPELAKESNLISYTHIASCGTSTKISVPCMFSELNRDEFSADEADGMENVLDVLDRIGVSVLWRDNNSGSKGVADRVAFEKFKSPDVNPVCDSECRDVGMLHGLQEYIDAQDGDILIVLHQMGNHGPAYFKRYPPEFERFTPACQSEELADCSKNEIDNAYDNAILYTDYFLSQVIALLKANTPQFQTAMLYVSDHGESLGEKGLYLHGMPYALAPAEQTEVPVIVWVGDSSDIDLASAVSQKDINNTHDVIFKALLDTFEVDSALTSDKPPLFSVDIEKGGTQELDPT